MKVNNCYKTNYIFSESSHYAFTVDGLVSNGLQGRINATEDKVYRATLTQFKSAATSVGFLYFYEFDLMSKQVLYYYNFNTSNIFSSGN